MDVEGAFDHDLEQVDVGVDVVVGLSRGWAVVEGRLHLRAQQVGAGDQRGEGLELGAVVRAEEVERGLGVESVGDVEGLVEGGGQVGSEARGRGRSGRWVRRRPRPTGTRPYRG